MLVKLAPCHCALALLLCLWAAPAAAEIGAPLTLTEAVRRAQARNPDFRALRARLDVQAAGVRIALARVLPQVALTGTYTHFDEEVVSGSATVVEQDELVFSGAGSIALFRPRALGGWLVAEEELEVSRAAAEYSAEALTLAVIELYLDVLRAAALLATAEEAVARRRRFLDAAETRLAQGLTDRSEAQGARLSLLDAEAEQTAAAARLAEARVALAVVLDLPPDAPPAVTGEAAAPPLPTSGLVLTGWAPVERADVRAALRNRERDRVARTFAWLDFLPDLELSSGFVQGPETFRDPDGFSWQVRLQATLYLYDGGERYGLIRREDALSALHAAELEAAEDTARREVHTARIRVDELARQVSLADDSLAVAGTFREDALRRLNGGVATLLDILDAETRLSLAQARARTLQHDLWLAQWRLVHARGELSEVIAR